LPYDEESLATATTGKDARINLCEHETTDEFPCVDYSRPRRSRPCRLLENEWEQPDGRPEFGEIDATVTTVLRLGSVSGTLKKRISWLSIKHMSA
jgi:hypothetical protein